MTAAEFKTKRQTIWKTQGRAAEALGVGVAAIKHWENNRRHVPGPVVRLIQCLEEALKNEVVIQ